MNSIQEYEQQIKWLNDRTAEYDAGNPTVTDKEWDNVYFEVQQYEIKNNVVNENSPTHNISYQVVSELKKKKHNHPMLSLAKTKELEDVKSFIRDKEYICMAKMDGLTCSLHYEGGKLISAETRGNGIEGEDITHNAFVIPSIPKKIRDKSSLTIDGEIICTYTDFDKWSKEYKNPRNFAAGSIRLLDAKECSKRDLTFVAWDLVEGKDDLQTLSERLSFLEDELLFITVPRLFDKNINLFDTLVHEVKMMAELSGYPIDGLVFKYNNVKEYQAQGKTDHHFRGGLAYKFYDEVYDTRLRYIDWTMGRTGVLTPVAVFDPIDIEGSVVERASLHNVSVMRETLGDCAYIGEPLKVFKANMIIPQIKEAGPKFNYGEVVGRGGASANDNPEFCPVCGKMTLAIDVSPTGVENMVCINDFCQGKLLNRLDHFCGKKGLDIRGLSKKTLEKLIDWEWLIDLVDLTELSSHREEWIEKPGFGELSVDKILSAIEKAFAEAPLSAFISGLGIPLIGTTVAKQICERVETWSEFRDLIEKKYDFTRWDGFGYEMAKALYDFDYSEADELVTRITFKPQEVKEEAEIGQSLEGKTFVITGKLVNYSNRQQLVDKITSAGGKVQSAISAKTMYLINNDINSTSAKNKKAKELNIPIITEQELEEMFNE